MDSHDEIRSILEDLCCESWIKKIILAGENASFDFNNLNKSERNEIERIQEKIRIEVNKRMISMTEFDVSHYL